MIKSFPSKGGTVAGTITISNGRVAWGKGFQWSSVSAARRSTCWQSSELAWQAPSRRARARTCAGVAVARVRLACEHRCAAARGGRAHKPPAFEFVAPQAVAVPRGQRADPPPLLEPGACCQPEPAIQIKTPHWQALRPTRPSSWHARGQRLSLRGDRSGHHGRQRLRHQAERVVAAQPSSAPATTSALDRVRPQLRVLPDGTREPATDTGALLRERRKQVVPHTFVLLRTTPEHREKKTGPPRSCRMRGRSRVSG